MSQLLIIGRYRIESRVVRVGFLLLHSDNHIPFLWCMWIAFHMVIWWLFWDWSLNLGGNLIKLLMRKRGVGCINSCKFLQLFFARKQAQFCACCFYVSFDFHHFSQIEITICNLSVPWFKVVLGVVMILSWIQCCLGAHFWSPRCFYLWILQFPYSEIYINLQMDYFLRLPLRWLQKIGTNFLFWW